MTKLESEETFKEKTLFVCRKSRVYLEYTYVVPLFRPTIVVDCDVCASCLHYLGHDKTIRCVLSIQETALSVIVWGIVGVEDFFLLVEGHGFELGTLLGFSLGLLKGFAVLLLSANVVNWR